MGRHNAQSQWQVHSILFAHSKWSENWNVERWTLHTNGAQSKSRVARSVGQNKAQKHSTQPGQLQFKKQKTKKQSNSRTHNKHTDKTSNAKLSITSEKAHQFQHWKYLPRMVHLYFCICTTFRLLQRSKVYYQKKIKAVLCIFCCRCVRTFFIELFDPVHQGVNNQNTYKIMKTMHLSSTLLCYWPYTNNSHHLNNSLPMQV